MLEPARFVVPTLIGTAALLSSPTRAQQLEDYFFQPRLEHTETSQPLDPNRGAAADFDADGDPDVLVARSTPQLLVNDGFGRFQLDTSGLVPATLGNHSVVYPVDIDQDGDTDVVFGSSGRILLNDGTGQFTVAPFSLPSFVTTTTVLRSADFDGDGDLDFVAAAQAMRLILDSGGNNYVNATSAGFGPQTQFGTSLAIGDVDGDSDVDIVFSQATDAVRIFLNDGAANFTVTTALPLGLGGDVKLTDIDADGDLDMVILRGGIFVAPSIEIFLNDGSGSFSTGPAVLGPGGVPFETFLYWLEVADIDNDGDLDIVSPSFSGFLVNEQTAPGVFTATTASTPLFSSGFWHTLEDFDGDGDLDVALPAGDTLEYWVNDGEGQFVGGLQIRVGNITGEDYGDLDGDGIVDALSAGIQLAVARNDGFGFFEREILDGLTWKNDSRFVDVNGDGELDILAVGGRNSGEPEQPRVYVNNGSGGFVDETATRLPRYVSYTREIVLGDFTGDGLQDAFLPGRPTVLLVATASGSFERRMLRPDLAWADAADLDGDGDLDLVVHNDFYLGPRTLVWLNDGSGRFLEKRDALTSPASSQIRRVQLVDIDFDGDSDLLLGDSSGGSLWLNDGTARFDKAVGAIPENTGLSVHDFATGDFDEDGDLDLVLETSFFPGLGSQTQFERRVMTNDGAGNFSLLGLTAQTGVGVASLVDVDGDLDLEMPTNLGNANRRRHLHSRLILRAGGPAEYDIHIQGGGFGQLFLADGIAATLPVTPAGAFRLTGTIIPIGAVPTGADDIAKVNLLFPNSPQLVGVTIYAQALTVSGAQIGVTNVASPQTVVR